MLTLQAKEKEIENLTPDKEFVRGTVGAICQVNFDEFWQGYEKWVVFKRNGYEPIKVMFDSLTNEIEIPHTILAESGEFQVGVFGVTETETLPTLYSDFIKIRYGTDTNATTPPKYTPSEIDQLRLSKQDKLTAGSGIKIDENNVISASGGGGIVGGTTDYELLDNLPSINGVQLVGNKTTSELGIEMPSINIEIVAQLPETANKNTIYLLPSENSQEQNLYDEYIYANGTWEKIGSASVEVDLTDYVKNTDYASADKAGVVKLKGAEGIWLNGNILTINQANEERINSRANKYPLVPSMLDYAIKVGLTTNTETLTDEEKAAAQSWLGINNSGGGGVTNYELLSNKPKINGIKLVGDISADELGIKGEKGDKGDAYTLTENDKQEIANMAIELFPIYEGEVEEV